MGLDSREKLFVFDVPDFLICPTRDIGDELPETPHWIPSPQLRNGRQQIGTLFAIHGKVFFTVGIRVTSSRGKS